METKKSWMGTFAWSHDHDSCSMAFGNPLVYVWEKKTSKRLSHPELEPFQKFTIPLENLQFHWMYVSLWEGFSEHCGLSPLRGPSAERSAVCSQALCVVSGEASANFERPSRSHFSFDSHQQAILVLLITRPLQRCFSLKIRRKMTSNEARKVGLVTVGSLGVVSGEVSADFSLDSRQKAILV